jgi:hypothetical protein
LDSQFIYLFYEGIDRYSWYSLNYHFSFVMNWLPIPGVSKTNYICVELPLIVIKFKTVFVLEGCLLCDIKTGD